MKISSLSATAASLLLSTTTTTTMMTVVVKAEPSMEFQEYLKTLPQCPRWTREFPEKRKQHHKNNNKQNRSTKEKDQQQDSPNVKEEGGDLYVPKPHRDGACDRKLQNSDPIRQHKRWRNRQLDGAMFLQTVQDEHTSYCPLSSDDDSFLTKAQPKMIGHDVTWIVENQSSGPVSISWIKMMDNDDNDNTNNNNNGDGTTTTTDAQQQQQQQQLPEAVSAFDPEISPAHLDPKAILMPGRYKPVQTYHGHVFQVHELLRDSGSGGAAAGAGAGGYSRGRLLLTHRVGLIPVGKRYQYGQCSPDFLLDEDAAPLKENWEDFEDLSQPQRDLNAVVEEFRRTPEQNTERCNVLYAAFINRLGCPVDLYYAGTTSMTSTSSTSSTSNSEETSTTTTNEEEQEEEEKAEATNQGNNNNNTTSSSSSLLVEPAVLQRNVPTCQEDFKFHLGINMNPTDYMFDWDSPLKVESTYLSHTWVARLTSHPEIVVDRITLEPTIVRDCPSEKKRQKVQTRVGMEVRVQLQAGIVDPTSSGSVSGSEPGTGEGGGVVNMTSSSSHQVSFTSGGGGGGAAAAA